MGKTQSREDVRVSNSGVFDFVAWDAWMIYVAVVHIRLAVTPLSLHHTSPDSFLHTL